MYMIENIENATSNVALAPLLLSIITLDNQSTTIRDPRHSIRFRELILPLKATPRESASTRESNATLKANSTLQPYAQPPR